MCAEKLTRSCLHSTRELYPTMGRSEIQIWGLPIFSFVMRRPPLRKIKKNCSHYYYQFSKKCQKRVFHQTIPQKCMSRTLQRTLQRRLIALLFAFIQFKSYKTVFFLFIRFTCCGPHLYNKQVAICHQREENQPEKRHGTNLLWPYITFSFTSSFIAAGSWRRCAGKRGFSARTGPPRTHHCPAPWNTRQWQ